MDLVRLVTVHPALVHFTIGALPVLVLAYIMGSRRRSRRWTFAGDVTLLVTTAITLLTSAFGLIAFLVLEWPGGLTLWKWLHLGLGAASTLVLVALSIQRLVARRRDRLADAKAVAGAVSAAVLVLVTGWIGGEVLVFRAGMAVEAAGEGALAPTVWQARDEQPDSVHDAMERIRPRWAEIQTEVSRMLVEHPGEERFAVVAARARELQDLARWMESYEGGEGAIAMMSGELSASVDEVLEQAEARDIEGLTGAVGELTASCAGCHEALRWGKSHEGHEH